MRRELASSARLQKNHGQVWVVLVVGARSIFQVAVCLQGAMGLGPPLLVFLVWKQEAALENRAAASAPHGGEDGEVCT